MGLTTVRVHVCNPEKPESCHKVELLVDTGAMYSVVPEGILKKMGLMPIGKRVFVLANGEKNEREVAGAIYKVDEYEGWSGLVTWTNLIF